MKTVGVRSQLKVEISRSDRLLGQGEIDHAIALLGWFGGIAIANGEAVKRLRRSLLRAGYGSNAIV